MTSDTSKPLTKTQVAFKILDSSERTVDRYMRLPVDPLPFIRISPRRIRFDESSVRAWVARRAIGGVE